MKRSKRITLMVAAALVALGLALCLGAMVAVGFDFTRFNGEFTIPLGNGNLTQIAVNF